MEIGYQVKWKMLQEQMDLNGDSGHIQHLKMVEICILITIFEQMYIPAEAANTELAEEFMAYMYSDEAVGIIAELGKSVVPVKGQLKLLENI